jgi:hypothetical protein
VTGGLRWIAAERYELRKRESVEQYKGRIAFFQKPQMTTIAREKYKR